MYSVAPRDSERFYLRLLLLHTPNVHGFEGPNGLRPHANMNFATAAELRGFLESDEEYDKLLHEAAGWQMPPQLRDLCAL